MLSKFKKIFHPNSPFYSLMLGLMSFFAVVISLFTLKEMQNQRELALTPVIYPQNFESIMVYTDTLCGDIFSKNIFIKKNENNVGNIKDWLNLGLINVGQGSAVGIEVEWDINYDWFVQYLDTLDIESNLFGIEVYESENEILYNFSECKSGTSSSESKVVKQSFSHLLSAAQNKEGLEIPIPKKLIQFPISCIRAGWHKHGQNVNNSQGIKLEHRLKISYKGVNEQKYSSAFKVVIDVFVPSWSSGQGNFHVKAAKDRFGLRIKVEKLD